MQQKNNFFLGKAEFKKWILPLCLLVFIIILKCSPSNIESYYSNGIYIGLSKFLRIITGWIPISLGDLLYFFLGIKLAIWIIKLFITLFKKHATLQNFGIGFLRVIKTLLWIYIIFNLLWALNYNRLGIAYQLKLSQEKYTKEEVENLVCDLVQKVNDTRKIIGNDTLPEINFKEIFATSYAAYETVAQEYNFLNYTNLSAKKSMYSGISHYMGFTGYYNPFSGEAQLSTDVPNILMPYIACHEMAHQLGYASESEANFVGYLACSKSKDIYFKYSVYLDLYKYAATELFLKDLSTTHNWELDSLVRNDYREIRNFYAKKRNSIAPLVGSMYSQYLKANQQSRGIESYNDVVGWLISYKKKYGKI